LPAQGGVKCAETAATGRPRAPAVADGAVDPVHVGHAGPAEEAPAAGWQRQVEQDGAGRQRRDQRAQVGEQLAGAGVQDVADADAAGHQVGAGRDPGQLDAGHVAGEEAGNGEVEHSPGLAGLLAEPGQDLADVAAVGGSRAEALRGRVAEHDPQGTVKTEDAFVMGFPVAGEGNAVLAHRVDAVGPAAERPGPATRRTPPPGSGSRTTPWWRRSRSATGAERRPVRPRRSGPGPRPDVTLRASAACSPPETVDTGQTTLNERMDGCQRAGIRAAVPPVARG
jgi:hypothetical protein